MSKSAAGANHAVALLDPPERIRKTIMRATTDSEPCVNVETAGPGVLNLLAIYQAFCGWTDEQMKQHFSGMRYGDLKKQVAEIVVSQLQPFQRRYHEMMAEPGYLESVLREGAERVEPIADATVRLTKERMGMW
jgi:tryptophanyl-tRNA synthetase